VQSTLDSLIAENRLTYNMQDLNNYLAQGHEEEVADTL
jgi:hypothetical protein